MLFGLPGATLILFGSGRDHCDLEFAVEIRCVPLRSRACSRDLEGINAISRLQLRSSKAEEKEREKEKEGEQEKEE